MLSICKDLGNLIFLWQISQGCVIINAKFDFG